MTVPSHYSRDIVVRCQKLINRLLPRIKEGFPDDDQFGGPLDTTFLLAMATPMILLPIERIFKPGNQNAAQVADDRELDPALTGEVAEVFGNERAFGAAPFYSADIEWSYVPGHDRFAITDEWSRNLLNALGSQQAVDAARNAPASHILLDLRNALAHGGIAYLDEDGRNTDGQATMFAFVGAKKRNGEIRLNILRIHTNDFATFLGAWTDWVSQAQLANALNNQSPVVQ